MSALEGPYEFWDMASGETRVVKVSRWETGLVSITPRYPASPRAKTVLALRLHLQPGSKETLPQYWDITSKLLSAGLMPHLTGPGLEAKTFTITKRGEAPVARFTLEVT